MAAIKFGAIVTDIRGKLGGHVFQKGNQSQVIKTKGKRGFRDTLFTRRGSSQLKVAQTNWMALSDVNKKAWADITPLFLQQNRFNDVLKLNGYQLYLKQNVTAAQAGFAVPIAVSGVSTLRSQVAIATATLNVTAQTLTFTITGTVGTFRFKILGQKVETSNSIINPKGWVLLGNWNAALSNNTGTYAALISKYGVISVGQTIYIGLELVNPFGTATFPTWVKAAITT